MASGSSSCAVAAACHHLGLVDSDITLAMPGGELAIRLDAAGHLWMSGPVEEVATIIPSQDLLDRLAALA